MPLYDYKCTQCGKIAEVRHGFDESYAEPCPACGGQMARVFNPAPIVFKGSGFYVTDSRKSSAANAPAKAESATASPAASSDAAAAPSSDATKTADATPAKASEPAA
jgi:putative FmdB family regulatory protein